MPRSYDNRRYPKGPNAEPGGESVLRGPKRIGPIRGVVPGDDIEVAREIARLWEWHYRLERQARRAQLHGSGGAGNFGCFTSKVLDLEDEDLVMYLDFQEDSGLLRDRSGNGSHSTAVVGTPEYDQTGLYPAEPSLKSVKFSPTTQQSSTDTFDHFVLPASRIAFGGTEPFAVEWVGTYLGVPTTHQTIVGAMMPNDSSGWELRIRAATNGAVFTFKRGSVSVSTPDVSSMNLVLGRKYHVLATFDGAEINIMVNGVPTGGGVATAASLTASTVAYLGRGKLSSTNYYFTDKMQALAIWSRVPTAEEFAGRSVCLTSTGVGDPDDINTHPDGRPPSTVYTMSGAGGSGATETYVQLAGTIVVPRYMYWFTRGYRLVARGAFDNIAGATQVEVDTLDWGGRAGTSFNPVAFTDAGPFDYVSPWVKVTAQDFTAPDEDGAVAFLAYSYRNHFFGSQSVGATTVQMYWLTEAEADAVVANEAAGDVPAAGTTDDILEWNGQRWVADKLDNANVDAAAAIARSKLNFGSGLVNADIAAAAAIAYSKLNLAASLVNADVAAGAAIAYAKLNLAAAIVNADIAAGANIAYAKLNLAAAIVNADVASGAAIAVSKLAAGTDGQILKTVAGVPTWSDP